MPEMAPGRPTALAGHFEKMALDDAIMAGALVLSCRLDVASADLLSQVIKI